MSGGKRKEKGRERTLGRIGKEGAAFAADYIALLDWKRRSNGRGKKRKKRGSGKVLVFGGGRKGEGGRVFTTYPSWKKKGEKKEDDNNFRRAATLPFVDVARGAALQGKKGRWPEGSALGRDGQGSILFLPRGGTNEEEKEKKEDEQRTPPICAVVLHLLQTPRGGREKRGGKERPPGLSPDSESLQKRA